MSVLRALWMSLPPSHVALLTPSTCLPALAHMSCHWFPVLLPFYRQVFLYLDRAYVVSTPGTLSVFQLGLRQLRSQFEAFPHVSLIRCQGPPCIEPGPTAS